MSTAAALQERQTSQMARLGYGASVAVALWGAVSLLGLTPAAYSVTNPVHALGVSALLWVSVLFAEVFIGGRRAWVATRHARPVARRHGSRTASYAPAAPARETITPPVVVEPVAAVTEAPEADSAPELADTIVLTCDEVLGLSGELSELIYAALDEVPEREGEAESEGGYTATADGPRFDIRTMRSVS